MEKVNIRDEILYVALDMFSVNGYEAIVGFVPTEDEKAVNGIRFTPMRFEGR